MSRTLSMSIPHNLTQAEVRRRIESGMKQAQTDHAAQFSNLTHTWTDNHLDFSLAILGQSISGHADINPTDISLHINLPWMLAAFADKIRPQIQAQADRLLAQ